jgi:ABC-type multidrug transport system ATPase subunit
MTNYFNLQSEKQVHEGLEIVSRSRTTICIAHRLSTIKRADKIIVLSRGQVVEQGTHDELYELHGIYHGLVEAQNLSAESDEEDAGEHKLASHDTRTNEFQRIECENDPNKDYTIIAKSGMVEKKTYKLSYILKRVIRLSVSADEGVSIQ